MDDDIPDWDILYPISQFVLSYKVPLPASAVSSLSPRADNFKITLARSSLNAVTKQRSLSIQVHHPSLIWTVIAFNSDVVSWSLPESPERGDIRHHVKEASRFGVDEWTLDMVLQLTSEQFEAAQRQSQRRKGQRKDASEADRQLADIRFDFSGLDQQGIWEARKRTNTQGASEDTDFFLKMRSTLDDHVDPMFLTAVAGVAYL